MWYLFYLFKLKLIKKYFQNQVKSLRIKEFNKSLDFFAETFSNKQMKTLDILPLSYSTRRRHTFC